MTPRTFSLALFLMCGALTAAPAPGGNKAEPATTPVADSKTVTAQTNRAAERYWAAMKLLRDGGKADWPKVRALLQECLNDEFSTAQNFVGLSMLSGTNGYNKAPRRGANYLLLAAKGGNAFAKLNLGLCHLTGTGLEKSPEKAMACLMECLSEKADFSQPQPPVEIPGAGNTAIEEGAPSATLTQAVDPIAPARALAHLALGDLLTRRKQGPEAQEHYVLAATLGHDNRAGLHRAAVRAAKNYAFGLGIPRDMAKAEEMLALSRKLLPHSANPFASVLLGQEDLDKLEREQPAPSDSDEGNSWELSLQKSIAGSFADPKSRQYNAREAVKWYELAAESGDAWAMLGLAFLHTAGTEGKPDMAKALEWFRQASVRGRHSLGTGNTVICLENGLGTPRDHAQALQLAKGNDLTEIICHLANIGQCPKAPLTYEQACELNRVWAEKKKDPGSQYLWALRWWYGWGVEADRGKAVTWLKKAAASNHGPALCKLGMICQVTPELLGLDSRIAAPAAALEFYERSAATGNAEALSQLGRLYATGTGCAVDKEKALELYRKSLALTPGASRAYSDIGAIYQAWALETRKSGRNEESERFATLMYENYRKAQSLKDPTASYNLGLLAYNGDFRKADKQEAFVHFDTAAEQGYEPGVVHHKLGLMLETGDGVAYAPREAAQHYQMAALNAHIPSLIRLCALYTSNWGFTQDWDHAILWLSLLTLKGDVPAQIDLGDALMRKQDYDQAFRHWNDLLESKTKRLHGPANERLSQLYAEGKGCERNAQKAAEHFKKALDLGNREAQFRRANELLADNKYPQAIPFLRQACEQGLRPAILKLGELSLRGQGVRQNEAYAFSCFTSLADSGDPEAMARLVEQTLKGHPKAPPLETALRYAERLGGYQDPRAPELLSKLQALRDSAK